LPTSSFFLVSTEITGGLRGLDLGVDVCELRIAVGMARASSVLRLCWREKPSLASSAFTMSALTGWPILVSAAASLSMLSDTHVKGHTGSPRVAGSTKRRGAGTSPRSFSATDLRPPPLRLMRPPRAARRRDRPRRG
jgi:hypothetical protein